MFLNSLLTPSSTTWDNSYLNTEISPAALIANTTARWHISLIVVQMDVDLLQKYYFNFKFMSALVMLQKEISQLCIRLLPWLSTGIVCDCLVLALY